MVSLCCMLYVYAILLLLTKFSCADGLTLDMFGTFDFIINVPNFTLYYRFIFKEWFYLLVCVFPLVTLDCFIVFSEGGQD